MGILVCGIIVFISSVTFADGAGSDAKVAINGASAARSSVVKLTDIVVFATNAKLDGGLTIGPADIDTARSSTTIEGLFEHFAGIDLNRKSFSGSDSQRLSIRGLDESRLLIMLNGRSLHGAGVYGGYYVDWASLSLEDVASVELIRGVTPAKYGNTLGGLVNITTAEGGPTPKTSVRAGGGSLGTWDVQARESGQRGRVSYSLSAGHYETDGYLRNAFTDRDMVSAKLGVSLPLDLKLSTGLRYSENETGMVVYNMPDAWDYDRNMPDSLGSQLGGPYVALRQSQTGPLDWGNGSYWKDRRLNFDVGISRESETFDFALQVYLMDQDREAYFYDIDDPTHLILQRNSEPEKNNWGWKGTFSNRLGKEDAHVLEYGLGGQYLGYGKMEVASVDQGYFRMMPTDSPSKSDPIIVLHNIYVQDQWFLSDTIQVTVGVRVDSYKADGPEFHAIALEETRPAPRLACSVTPWLGGRATARIGHAYRFPTNPEYYWWYSGYQPAARKDLTSEKADQYELELTQDLTEKLSVLVRGYHYKVDNYIRTLFGYRPSRVVYNIGQVDFTGVECEASYEIFRALKVSANVTHQETKKHGDVLDNSTTLTDNLPELPENKINLMLAYAHDKGLHADIKVGYVDKRWSMQGDLTSYLTEMDSYFDIDARVSYPVYRDQADREVRIEIAVDNLLDEKIVEEYGYPMPGTTVLASVRAVF